MTFQSKIMSSPIISSAPITFNDKALSASFRPEDLQLDYSDARSSLSQQRYKGRVLLKPDIDLSLYRFAAVIDWIAFSFRLPETDPVRQARNIHEKLKKHLGERGSRSGIFVSGPDQKRGYSGKSFVCRIQDPRPREFRDLMDFVKRIYNPVSSDGESFRIVGIEISFDSYVKYDGLTEEDRALHRWKMTNLTRRHFRYDRKFLENPMDNARFTEVVTEALIDTNRITRVPELTELILDNATSSMLNSARYRSIPTDATFYIGAKDAPVMFRSMDKVTDQRDPATGSREVLDPSDRRARLEVRVKIDAESIERGEGLKLIGMETPDRLFGFRFERSEVTKFRFWLATLSKKGGELDLGEREVFEKSGVAGLEHYQGLWRDIDAERKPRVGQSQPLGEKDFLMAYPELNDIARCRLRSLSKIWRI